jgi:predicted nucleic acid-binding protein
MSAPVIDTSILIDHLRKRPEAETYLLSVASLGLCTHATGVAELLVGIRDKKELQALDSLMQPFQILHPNDADSKVSLDLLRQLRLTYGIGYLDTLIADGASLESTRCNDQ